LALAREGRIEPVIVLTKIDVNDRSPFIEQATSIAPNVQILAVNALDPTHSAGLLPWLAFGRTAAFVGSSGVGKSTLVNALANVELETHGIREHDSKGRHTTTSRHMFEVVSGGWVIDTPGMRELNVGAAEAGISATFEDVEAIARACRFRDCTHAGDAGCAVSDAIEHGQLTRRRFDNYLKLRREAQRATQSIRERREKDRQFGRMAKAVLERRKWERGDA
jgi:ribosome biogenesis GTPase